MSKNKFIKKLLVAGLCALTATAIGGTVACKSDSSEKEPNGAEQTQKYDVVFDLDGGTGSVSTQQVEEGAKATKPADPVKTGYRFAGWVLASDGSEFSFDTPITYEITLKATWVQVFTVTFETGNASSISSQTVDINGKATKPADPTQSGYTFDGWYKEATYETAFDFNSAITANTTVYAKWKQDESVTPPEETVEVESVTLDKTQLTLTVGSQETLTATVTPDNATDKTVTWLSSDTSVATVSGGVVTAVAEGTVTITAKAGNYEATCTVTVNELIPEKYTELAAYENVIIAERFSEVTTLSTFEGTFGTKGIYQFVNDKGATEGENYVLVSNGVAKLVDTSSNGTQMIVDLGDELSGVVEGYVEVTTENIGNSWTFVQFVGTSENKLDEEVFGIRTDSNALKYRLDGGSVVAPENPITSSNTKYCIYFKFDLQKSTVTLTINGTAFVTDLQTSITDLCGIKLISSDSTPSTGGDRVLTIDNLVVAYTPATLESTRSAYLSRLESVYNSYDLVNEYATNGADVTTAYNTAKTAIENAEDESAILSAYNNGVEAMSAIKSDSDIALENAKSSAISELESYVDADDYTTNAEALTDAINNGKAAINDATSIEEVNTALAKAKAEIDLIENDTLAAKTKYTVTFANTDLTAVEVIEGETLAKPDDPVSANAVFVGWYSDSAMTTEFDFENTAITEATTIYAKWYDTLTLGEVKQVLNLENLTLEDLDSHSDIINYNGTGFANVSATATGTYNDVEYSYTSSVKYGGATSSSRNLTITLTEKSTVFIAMTTGSNGTERGIYIDTVAGKTSVDTYGSVTSSSVSELAILCVELEAGTYYINNTADVRLFAIKIISGNQENFTVTSISGTPATTRYSARDLKVGAAIDLSGLEFTVLDGENIALSEIDVNLLNIQVSDSDDFYSGVEGTYTVKVSYGKYTSAYEYEVTVYDDGSSADEIYVRFETGAGPAVATQTIAVGGTATEPEEPVWSGYYFGGWYTDKNCTVEFDFSTDLNSDITLYALWYEDVTVQVSFLDAISVTGGSGSGYKPTSAITVGRITYASGVYFEDNYTQYFDEYGDINTQAKSQAIKFDLNGTVNSVSLVARNAADNVVYLYKLTDGAYVVVDSFTLLSANAESHTFSNLEAGSYAIDSGAVSVRIGNLKITERLAVSSPDSIHVSGATQDFVVGDEFNYDGLTANLHYENGREDLLDLSVLTVDSSAVNMDAAGAYTVTVTYGDFSDTYTVYVYGVDSITLGTNKTVSGRGTTYGNGTYENQAAQQVYFVGDTFNADGFTVTLNGSVTVGEKKLTQTFLYNPTVNDFEGFDTTTADVKTLTITVDGQEDDFTYVVLEKPAITADTVNVYVDGSLSVDPADTVLGAYDSEKGYQFATVQQALDFLELCNLDDNVTKVITLAAGTYNEKLEINIPNLSIVGISDEDGTKPLIEWDSLYDVPDESGYLQITDSTATLNVREGAVGFSITNVTISNYWNSAERFLEANNGVAANEHRALAMLIQADKVVVDNCELLGYQDTIELFTGRQIIKNSLIAGTTDFIFGTNNTTYFYNCEIRSIRTDKAVYTEGSGWNTVDGGYITAFKGYNKSASDAVTYGAIFDSCKFTAEEGVSAGNTAIGRPWGAYAAVMVMNSELGGHISTVGYDGASKNERYVSMGTVTPDTATVKFVEYNNTGAGAITEQVAGMTLLTDETAAAKYNDLSVIFGEENGYEDVWDGSKGATVTEFTYSFADYEYESNKSTGTTDAPLSYFDGAVEVVGGIRMNGNSAQVDNGTVITLKKRGEITVNWYGGSLGNENDGVITYKDGYATLTIVGTGNVYIISITVDTTTIPDDTPDEPEIDYTNYVYSENTTINLLECEGTYEGSSTEWHAINIDASSGKFDNRGTDIQVNSGVIISFKVAENANDSTLTIGVVAYNNTDATSNFEIKIEDGIATLTAIQSCYIKAITLSYV